MTWPVMLLVLLGALLNASWNALVKSSPDKTLDTALIHRPVLTGGPARLFVRRPTATRTLALYLGLLGGSFRLLLCVSRSLSAW